ncbi:MAG: VOC family protein [Polyangiales bacterium]
MEINGIAHTFLTVADFPKAREFYGALLPFLGMKPVMDMPGMFYCVGGKTALGIREATEENRESPFDQWRPGLHHLCFRARNREDVDEAFAFLEGLDATIIHPPKEGMWAPGYYSMLFEDPDGVRLEINFVPGKGLL